MDKQIALSQLPTWVHDGDIVAFGGGSLVGSLQRKPMAAAKALAASTLSHIRPAVFLGGPEVDLLIGLGKVSQLHFAYMGFDQFGLAPHFRRAREGATLDVVEYSEFMFMAALEAAIKKVPFMPTHHGLGTDLLETPNSPFKVFHCPFTAEPLVAVPAVVPDVAIIHVNIADRSGNGLILGDAYADLLMVKAARRVILTAERVVDKLPASVASQRSRVISRIWVDAVCETPGGAAFTALYPDYQRDDDAIDEYCINAHDQAWLRQWVAA